MPTWGIISCGVSALTSLARALGPPSPAKAGGVPGYFKEIVGVETATPTEVGVKNILALNSTMFDLYANAAQIFQKNILAEHPVILGLFSGAGGRFILYRPGTAPLEAPSVPIVYQLLKSVGHSTMALSEVVTPYLNSPNDSTWRSPLAPYRSRIQSALDGLDAAPLRDDWKPVSRAILENNIAFTDEALKANVITRAALHEFAKKQGPLLKKNIAWAARLKNAVIMDVEATTAVHQAEVGAAKTMLDRTERLDVTPSRLVADAGYGSAEMVGWLVDKRGIEPHVKLMDKSDRKDRTFSRSDFAYDPEGNLYVCPGGKELKKYHRAFSKPHDGLTKDGTLLYFARKHDCDACALKQKCCPNTPARKIARSIHEAARDKARAIAKTEAYVVSRCERKKVEMLFAHLKRILGLGKLRLRGPSGAKDEFLLAATAQNLRKLAKLFPVPAPIFAT
jgi:hypothetical protein